MSTSPNRRLLALIGRLYGVLLIAFPKEFRARLGTDARQAFQDGCRAALKRRGALGLAAYALRGALDVAKEAPMERIAAWRQGRRERQRKRERQRTQPRREVSSLNGRGMGMDGLIQDIRFAVRAFSRRPAFTAVALLTLMLGIGASTSIFSVLNGVLLRPFPYPDADRLVVFWNTNPERGRDQFRMSAPDFLEFERSATSFTGMTLATGATSNLTGDNLPPLRVEGAMVSANFFSLLGVDPLMGRTFRPEENQGDHRVAVLSHALWQDRFGGDPDILGKLITMDGLDVQVVGVMPPVSIPIGGSAFQLPSPHTPLYWIPLDYTLDWVIDIGAHVMAVVARMRDGVSLPQAQSEMSALAAALAEESNQPGQSVIVRSLREQVVGDIRRDLVILMAAVGLLLLMACGNLANLLLARATDREKELAVRTAMGAGGKRLVRQVLTEILLLGSVGGLAGLGLARWGSNALLTLVPSSLPRQSEVDVDPTVLLFTAGVVLLSTLLVGLVPSLQVAGRDPAKGLRVGGRDGTADRERQRTNQAIVVFQLSLAAILLVGAGLLLRSFQTLRTIDPGFRGEGVLTAQIMLPSTRYEDPGATLAFFDRLQERVEGLPGVSSVALSMDHPMQSTWWNGISFLDRPPPEPGEGPLAMFRPVSTGYFSTLGIPLLEGRAFDRADRFDQPGVMVVNQAFVERYFPEGNPLGERVEFVVGPYIWGSEAPTEFEIVGVVGDVRFNGVREPSEPAFHIPMHQFPYAAVKVLVRTSGDPEALADPVQAGVWELDPDLPVTDIRTMDQIFATAVAQDRFNAILLGAFALAALVLAAAGIYGVLSYTVARRTGEMGIRMALGAEPGLVLGMVLRDAAVMAGTGLGVGLVASLVVSRFLASLLFGVPTYDPLVLLGVSLLLGVVALASGLVPALKAARTDPVVALRAE